MLSVVVDDTRGGGGEFLVQRKVKVEERSWRVLAYDSQGCSFFFCLFFGKGEGQESKFVLTSFATTSQPSIVCEETSICG